MTTPNPAERRPIVMVSFRRRTIIAVVVGLFLLAGAQLCVGGASFLNVQTTNDRVDTDAVDACNRGNGTRQQINAGLYAVDATNGAVASLSGALDVTVDALIAAFTPPEGLDAEAQATATHFRDTVANATDVTEQQLAVARAMLEVALLPARDCPHILADPNAVTPPSTLPPAPTTTLPAPP